jgi:hypothetical protein
LSLPGAVPGRGRSSERKECGSWSGCALMQRTSASKPVVSTPTLHRIFVAPDRTAQIWPRGPPGAFPRRDIRRRRRPPRSAARRSRTPQGISRRYIGEGGARLRGADRAVNKLIAFQRSDDVAADLPPRQPQNLPPCDRLQISDGGQRKGFGPGRLCNAVLSSRMRGSNRRGEAGFGAQRLL